MPQSRIDSAKAPLFEAMLAHSRSGPLSFHVPGHKSGRGLDAEAETFFQSIMSIDYTEITGLDDLHHAEGVILEAQQLAAACFGAEETHFLVGGSTVGNLAMLQGVCGRGDVLLVQRDVHKSVINGLMLTGARAVFLPPAVDPESGLAAGVRPETVEQALRQHPDAQGVFLTNPNYYGLCTDMKRIADIAHSFGKPLLVDEAHGAHFGFHPELPPSAISCGADAVVQSTHKMLTAMTMGAMLHLQGSLVDRARIKQSLTMLQSSSPSYPILASLDLARRKLHTEGARWIEQGLAAVQAFRLLMQTQPAAGNGCRIDCRTSTQADPFKLALYDAAGIWSGPELRAALEAQGCFVEMADARHALLLFSPASIVDDAMRLYQAIRNICLSEKGQKQELSPPISNINIIPLMAQISSPIAFDLRHASGNGERGQRAEADVSAEDAVGRLSAEMVIPYPPGIPYLYPGELITQSAAETLQKLARLGIKLQGTRFGETNKLKVFI